MKHKQLFRGILAVLLILAMTTSVVAVGLDSRSAQIQNPLRSAAEEWTMGSGWGDYSTASDIVFRNMTDSAGPNFNRNLIDGSKGFRISYDLEFLEKDLQSTADVTLRVQSNTLLYFRILATARGDENMFEVSFCNNGTWSTVVPFVAGMVNTTGKLNVEIAREENDNHVTFILRDGNGNVLLEQTVISDNWAGNRFLNKSDLEFIITPIKGYGTFQLSGYNVETYPDDGIDRPLSASDSWTIGNGWEDLSDAQNVVIATSAVNAGPTFYKELIPQGASFRLGFRYTGLTGYSTADVTLRLTANNGVYIRMLVTKNEAGQALVDVNYHNGSWHALGSTGWIADVGDTYDVVLEHTAGTDTMRLVLTKPDGSLIGSWDLSGQGVCTHDLFFNVSSIEPLVTTAGGDYGMFSISNFTLDAESVPVADWTMGENWSGTINSNGKYVISNNIQNAGPNFYKQLIPAGEDFRLGFLYTGISDYATADVTLRLTINHGVYIRMLVTKNEQGQALVDVNFHNGSWHVVGSTGWIADIGDSYYVYLSHKTGSDALTLTLAKPDGTQFYSQEIAVDALTDTGFFQVSAIEPLVTTAGEYGLFSITGFAVDKPEAANSQWTLGTGWQDEGGFDGSAVGNTTDTGASPLFYNQKIDALDGLTLDFDFSAKVEAMQTTAELILRKTDNHNQYLRMVITARGPREYIVETAYFDGAAWISLDSTGWLSSDSTKGAYHVSLKHQANSTDTALVLTAMDGTELYAKSFSNAAFTDSSFYGASYLELLFNPIPGYGCFTISNMEVGDYPPELAETDLWEYGNGWAVYGQGDSLYLAKTDGTQTEIHYSPSINGAAGFKIGFDVAYDSLGDTTCYFKLRLPTTPERYLFVRVKGSNGQILMEAQSYNAGSTPEWSSGLLSADAGRWTPCTGMVTVVLERQAMSEEMHLNAIDSITGQILMDEIVVSDVLSINQFLDYENLKWCFGTDAGSPTYKVYNFSVTDYPADPVAAEEVTISGDQALTTGDTATYSVAVAPDNATVKSYTWLVGSTVTGNGKSFSYRFSQAGSYEVKLQVVDYSGNTLEKTLTVTVTDPPIVYELGDVDCNGVIDRADAQLLCQYLVGEAELSQAPLALSDVNGDGVVNSIDAYCIIG